MASILRIRTTFTGTTGAPYLSTMFFSRVDTGSAPAAASAVGAFWAYLTNNMSDQLDWVVEPFADVLDDVTGNLTGLDPIGGGESGTGASSGELLPPATQGLLRLATSSVVSGRILRGRVFLPGATEDMSDAGVPDASYLADVSAAYALLTGDPDAELLIWSRTHGVSHPVTGGGPWNQWAVLRSRRD